VGTGITDSAGAVKLKLTDSGSSYEIVLTNVPQAYEAKPSYSFSSTVVSINLTTVPVLDPNDHSQAMYTAGSTMANFVLTDIDGNTYDLSQLRQQKKLIILDFWYVNCAPCKKEFPYFQSMLEQYGDDVILLAVNNIDSEESMRQLREELAADPATAVTFPMIKDTLGLSQGFGVTAYPVTVFIDPDGKVVSVHKDAFASEEAFLTQVKKYLK
jgi:thiol-disulfide isomerase/thioredoxin